MKALLSFFALASILTSVALLNYLAFTYDKLVTAVIATDVAFVISLCFATYSGAKQAIKQANERKQAVYKLRSMID